MQINCLDKVDGVAVVHQEFAVAKPPQRRASKLGTLRLSLRYSVIKRFAHSVKRQIRIQMYRLVPQCGHCADRRCHERRRVTRGTPDVIEDSFAVPDRLCSTGSGGRSLRWSKEAHECRELLNVAECI